MRLHKSQKTIVLGQAFDSAILVVELFVLRIRSNFALSKIHRGIEDCESQDRRPGPADSNSSQRRTGATGICQRICKAHVFDERSASTALSMRRSSSRRHMRSRWSRSVRGEAE